MTFGILIQEGEGTTLEFKESLSSSFARELVAPRSSKQRYLMLVTKMRKPLHRGGGSPTLSVP